MPFLREDTKNWPDALSPENLAPFYEKAVSLFNLAAEQDELADIFPPYTTQFAAHKCGRQAESLLVDLRKSKEHLNKEGIFFGSSRLAVRVSKKNGLSGCVYCGLCMVGCPYGLIYDSAQTVEALKADITFRDKFNYMPNVVVTRVTENKNGTVKVFASDAKSGEPLAFEATRVFLACGALASTKIILSSKGHYNVPISIAQSQVFFIPLFRYQGVDKVIRERLHTLTQIFIEIFDKKINQHWVHLQVYTYFDFYRKLFERALGFFYPLFYRLIEKLLGHIIFVQGAIHSDESSSILMQVKKNHSGPDRIFLSRKKHPQEKKLIKAITKKILNNRQYLKAFPLLPLTKIMQTGGHLHYGASFPMAVYPNAYQSDLLGRPVGFTRVHLVDASVLPSIPATTITLAVMANAYRIGTESPLE